MEKFLHALFVLLTRSFISSALCLGLAWIGPEGTLFVALFATCGFIGLMATFWLFVIHMACVILKFILRL